MIEILLNDTCIYYAILRYMFKFWGFIFKYMVNKRESQNQWNDFIFSYGD